MELVIGTVAVVLTIILFVLLFALVYFCREIAWKLQLLINLTDRNSDKHLTTYEKWALVNCPRK